MWRAGELLRKYIVFLDASTTDKLKHSISVFDTICLIELMLGGCPRVNGNIATALALLALRTDITGVLLLTSQHHCFPDPVFCSISGAYFIKVALCGPAYFAIFLLLLLDSFGVSGGSNCSLE